MGSNYQDLTCYTRNWSISDIAPERGQFFSSHLNSYLTLHYVLDGDLKKQHAKTVNIMSPCKFGPLQFLKDVQGADKDVDAIQLCRSSVLPLPLSEFHRNQRGMVVR